MVPCLQEYGNISYHTESAGQTQPLDTATAQLDEFEKYDKKGKKAALSKKNDHLKPVVPIISIDLPD